MFTSNPRAISLSDGRVMFAGGGSGSTQKPSTNVDVFSQANGLFTAESSLATGSMMGVTIGLSDGGALMAGGVTVGNTPIATAQRWSASTGQWTTVGDMHTVRFKPSATRLSDGTILVAGGALTGADSDAGLSSAEIFNPSTDAFTLTGSLTFGRLGQVASLLPSGKVLVWAGASSGVPTNTSEIYDPTSGTFSTGPSLNVAHLGTACARLLDGRVLIAGGCGTGAGCTGTAITTCEIYDPTTNTISLTGSLNSGSAAHSMITLASGKVLLVGGMTGNFTPLSRAELYDPATGTWTLVGSLAQARFDAGIALLPNGDVLVAGGRNAQSSFLSSAEIFEPSVPGTASVVCQADGSCINTSL